MLAAIDLTHRQANRVLQQALRARAQVEIEPRMQDRMLRGTLTKRKVLSEIKNGRGTQFDDAVAAAMVELIEAGQVIPIKGDDTTIAL